MIASGARPRHLLTIGLLTVLTAALTPSHPASAATTTPVGAIARVGSDTAVPESYLVVLRDEAVRAPRADSGSASQLASTAAVSALADRLSAGYGGTVAQVYHAALRGFEVRMPESAARRLAADPAVAYVEQNQFTPLTAGTQLNPPSWGLDRIDQRYLPLDNSYSYPNTAPNVHAYVLDTGIRAAHLDFDGVVLPGYDAIDGTLPADDCNGHGTHVAGIIGGQLHGVAKDVKLVPVRVLGCPGSATLAQVIAGIDWTTANAIHPAVAHLGVGGAASAVVDTAVTNSINSGITYTVPSGSSNSSACNFSPARVPQALTVSGTTSTDARMGSSNYGPCLDIFAPGQSITSTWITSNTATAVISGGTMASAHVAGCAALLLSDNPSWTPAQVASHLTAHATPSIVGNPGTGSPNRLLYCGA